MVGQLLLQVTRLLREQVLPIGKRIVRSSSPRADRLFRGIPDLLLLLNDCIQSGKDISKRSQVHGLAKLFVAPTQSSDDRPLGLEGHFQRVGGLLRLRDALELPDGLDHLVLVQQLEDGPHG